MLEGATQYPRIIQGSSDQGTFSTRGLVCVCGRGPTGYRYIYKESPGQGSGASEAGPAGVLGGRERRRGEGGSIDGGGVSDGGRGSSREASEGRETEGAGGRRSHGGQGSGSGGCHASQGQRNEGGLKGGI